MVATERTPRRPLQSADEGWRRFATSELDGPLEMMLSTLPHHTSWQTEAQRGGITGSLKVQLAAPSKEIGLSSGRLGSGARGGEGADAGGNPLGRGHSLNCLVAGGRGTSVCLGWHWGP